MIEELTRAEYQALLRQDFTTFVARCFHELNPQAELAMNWHLEVVAAKLTAVRQGKIRRLIINLPPRHLKSLMASIAFPAWCLGHDPSAQILCVSYAQDLADKLARDCRSIMMSPWYRQIFRTRLAAHRQAVQEFVTTRHGYRLATSIGGVLDRARCRHHHDRRSLEARGGAFQSAATSLQPMVRPHPLQPAQRQAQWRDCHYHAAPARG
jgi:hypothetical protein